LIKAYTYLKTHPQLTIRSVYEGQYGVTPVRAAAISAAVGHSARSGDTLGWHSIQRRF